MMSPVELILLSTAIVVCIGLAVLCYTRYPSVQMPSRTRLSMPTLL